MGNVWTSITKGNQLQPHDKPIPLSSKNCMNCHAAILKVNEIGYEDLPVNSSLKGQGLIIAHEAHVNEYDVACVECHRGIVHRDPDDIGKYETNWPFMHTDCGVCHNGQYSERFDMKVRGLEEEKDCFMCHPTYQPPPAYDAGEY